ncbi:ABC transporter permease [soil metagenome]
MQPQNSPPSPPPLLTPAPGTAPSMLPGAPASPAAAWHGSAMGSAANIFRLGVKELWSLVRDPMMLVLIVYTFTVSIYVAATAMPESLHNAPIAIVDEDGSPLSARIVASFYPPHFKTPAMVSLSDVDPGMDNGDYTFVLDIPPNFQRDVLARLSPAIQLNIDATRMSQAFTGSGYIQQIVASEVNEFVQRYRSTASLPVELMLRMRFNPNLEQAWFGSLMEIINNVTMLSIILTGAALIREREHGTIEHLLVMPVTPAEIMLAKVWSMGLVVLLAALVALVFVVQGILHVPVQGSIALFMLTAALHLFATTSIGIFLATLARSMPQFGMLLVLVLLPLQLLSGGATPRESMPAFVQDVMLAAPTTHFVSAAQAILYRGAGIDVVWPQLLAIFAIGAVLFAVSLTRFRKTISQMG